jgi:hypothetical protein
MTDYCSLNIIEYHFYKFVTLSVNDTNKRKNALINMSCIQSFLHKYLQEEKTEGRKKVIKISCGIRILSDCTRLFFNFFKRSNQSFYQGGAETIMLHFI